MFCDDISEFESYMASQAVSDNLLSIADEVIE
jgi:hypothetical protein